MEQLLTDFSFLEREDVLEAIAFAAAAMDETYMPLTSQQAARA